MIYGRYTKEIDLRRYEAPKLNLLVRSQNLITCFFRSCGSSALSILINKPARIIDKEFPKTARNWNDRNITAYLRNLNYTVLPITKNGITSLNPNGNEYMSFPLNRNHCLLLNCLVCKHEASYFVWHKDFVYHNFRPQRVDNLFFINKPTQTVFLIWHSSWASKIYDFF